MNKTLRFLQDVQAGIKADPDGFKMQDEVKYFKMNSNIVSVMKERNLVKTNGLSGRACRYKWIGEDPDDVTAQFVDKDLKEINRKMYEKQQAEKRKEQPKLEADNGKSEIVTKDAVLLNAIVYQLKAINAQLSSNNALLREIRDKKKSLF